MSRRESIFVIPVRLGRWSTWNITAYRRREAEDEHDLITGGRDGDA